MLGETPQTEGDTMTPGRSSPDGTRTVIGGSEAGRKRGASPSTRRSDVERPPEFIVDVWADRDHVVVAPVGELDMATAPKLREAIEDLLGQGWDRLVIDLTGATFIDSTGLELLLREEGQTSGTFELIVPSGQVQRLIELTRLQDHFAIRDKSSHRRSV